MWVCFGLSRRQDHGKREQVSLSETRSRSETLLSTIRRFVSTSVAVCEYMRCAGVRQA